MRLPPGPAYILKNLHHLVLPPLCVFFAHKILITSADFTIPSWGLLLCYIISLPTTIFLKVQYRDIRNKRAADAHGAVLPPQIFDKWPGGLSVLKQVVANFKDGYPGDVFLEWEKTYGYTWNMKILFANKFFTSEPEYIKAILSTMFDSFEKGVEFNGQMHSLLGTGVFNSDGDMWRFHRSMTRPFFSKDRIGHFDIFDRHAEDALGQLKARLREGYPVDIQDLAYRFTMDCATEFLFGKDVRSLGCGIPHPHYSPLFSTREDELPANQFAKAFDEAQGLVALRSRYGGNWPLTEFWKDKIVEKMVTINRFIDPILRAAVDRKRAADSLNAEKVKDATLDGYREVKDGESFLDHLLHYTDDDNILRDEILNILMAARDTTANSIAFAVYMLAEHPQVCKRLRQEILENLGESRRPTIDDLKNMKYLRAVINETMRLYPAIPFNSRETSKAVVLPGKYGQKPFYIPENSQFPYSVLLMQRRTDLWGPDANEFDPDRFLDERLHNYLTPNPSIFLPFNAGPRICPGQQFAYHQISFFLIRLLQQFSSISHVYEAQPPASRPPPEWAGLEGTKGKEKIRIKTYISMSIMGGYWVKMEEAKEEVTSGPLS